MLAVPHAARTRSPRRGWPGPDPSRLWNRTSHRQQSEPPLRIVTAAAIGDRSRSRAIPHDNRRLLADMPRPPRRYARRSGTFICVRPCRHRPAITRMRSHSPSQLRQFGGGDQHAQPAAPTSPRSRRVDLRPWPRHRRRASARPAAAGFGLADQLPWRTPPSAGCRRTALIMRAMPRSSRAHVVICSNGRRATCARSSGARHQPPRRHAAAAIDSTTFCADRLCARIRPLPRRSSVTIGDAGPPRRVRSCRGPFHRTCRRIVDRAVPASLESPEPVQRRHQLGAPRHPSGRPRPDDLALMHGQRHVHRGACQPARARCRRHESERMIEPFSSRRTYRCVARVAGYRSANGTAHQQPHQLGSAARRRRSVADHPRRRASPSPGRQFSAPPRAGGRYR